WGLLILLALEFVRPQQIIPALAPLHLPRLLTMWVALAWVLQAVVARRSGLMRDRQNAVMIGVLVVAAISVPGAYWPGQATGALVDLAKKIVAFFLIINLATDRRRVGMLVWTLVLLNAWLAANQIAAYAAATPDTPLARLGGGTDSFLGNTIDFAVAIAVVLPYAAFLTFAEKRTATVVAAALFTGLFVVSMVATGARSGAVALVVLAVVVWAKSPRKVVGLAVIGALLAGCWILSPTAYRERVLSIREYRQDASAMGRIENWGVAYRMLRDRPFIGVGIDNFAIAYGVRYSPAGEQRWAAVHNVVLQAAAELGVVGLTMYLLLLFFVLGDNRRTRALAAHMVSDQGRWYRNLAHGVDASLIGFLVTSLFATTLYYPHLYLIAGLAVALKHAALADAPAEAAP
ncbi:MAG: O-antigen ligase family protein, partial [Armatimonadota bacterium]